MSKDITEKKHQNIADGAEGVQVQVAPLDKVLDAVAAKEPKNFNLHQVFDKDDEQEVDEQLFGEIFDEALGRVRDVRRADPEKRIFVNKVRSCHQRQKWVRIVAEESANIKFGRFAFNVT